jgi:ComF family protein
MDGIRATALFEGTLREAIHALKYKNMRSLAPFLGQMLVETYEAEALPADVLVPVPLHRRRLRERGYNQSSLLAKYVGQVTGLPVSTTSLRRVRYTISQTQLNAEERVHNVSGAFLCSREDVGDRQVLLIDDVCTTGATLEACSVALYDGGARSVWALTVARAS